jgi:glucan 1,3-beta-glucosidase
VTGADEYVEKAIGWARSAGMRVLLDLHGLPGSQNGQDHSGHAGPIDWQQGDNLARSTEIVYLLSQKYGTNEYADVVWGIETVNEPTANSPNNFDVSKQWSLDAYNTAQKVIENKNLNFFTHDSFRGPKNFIDIGTGLKTFGVDQHNYQLYTDEDKAMNQQQHIAKACGWASDLAETKASIPVIVGEWSGVTNICVNPDGSTTAGNSCSTEGCQCASDDVKSWNPQLVEQVRRYVEAQLDVYEQNSNGYFVWSYGGPGSWGPENLIANGAWPQPLTERKYPGQCGGY